MTTGDSQPTDRTFTDPEFAAFALTTDPDETLDVIHDTVKGLHATATPLGTKIRTTNGALVAVVDTPQAASDDAESILRYRTQPATALATRKATTIRRRLDGHEAETDADAVTAE